MNNAFFPLQINFLPFASYALSLCFILCLCTLAKTSSSLLLGHPSQLPTIPPYFGSQPASPISITGYFAFSSARHSPHLIVNVLSRRKRYYGFEYFPAKQNKHSKTQKFRFIPLAEFLLSYVIFKKVIITVYLSNYKNRENCLYMYSYHNFTSLLKYVRGKLKM